MVQKKKFHPIEIKYDGKKFKIKTNICYKHIITTAKIINVI